MRATSSKPRVRGLELGGAWGRYCATNSTSLKIRRRSDPGRCTVELFFVSRSAYAIIAPMTARVAVSLLITAALLANGVWHVADAKLHGHAHVVAVTAADVESPVGDVGHVDDSLAHPMHEHQQAYLYRVELGVPSVRVDGVDDPGVNRFVAGYSSRPFRPPAI